MSSKSTFSLTGREVLRKLLSNPGNIVAFAFAGIMIDSIIITFLLAILKIPAIVAAVVFVVVCIAEITLIIILVNKLGLKFPPGKITPSGLIVPVLAVMQIVAAILTKPEKTEALYRLRYATQVYESGQLAVRAPYMSLMGALASLVKLHPVILANTLVTAVVIAISYLAYRTLAVTVVGDNKCRMNLIMIGICILNLYGYQSDKALPASLLAGSFTTESLIIHIILPLATAFIICLEREKAKLPMNETEDKEIGLSETDDDYQEEWDMKKHKIINARNLAIALGVVVVMLLAFVYILNNKINTLYDATLNMQSEMNSSCKTYEFSPNGTIEGYIIKNSDGSLTVIGGGSSSNADALTDAIKNYSDKVDTWYLYGEDDDNAGAYKGCISSGVTVKNVFVIERTDI